VKTNLLKLINKITIKHTHIYIHQPLITMDSGLAILVRLSQP